MAGHETGGHNGRSFQTILKDFGKTFSSMKQPSEFIILLTYCTVMYSPIRICVEAGVFRHLAASSQPVPAGELINVAAYQNLCSLIPRLKLHLYARCRDVGVASFVRFLALIPVP